MASQLNGVAEALSQLRAARDLSEPTVIRGALRAASVPIQHEMEARAPVGDLLHKTYKGRIVAPGFLRRSIRVIVTRVKKTGAIFAVFGVRKEAFYGLAFVERGTIKRAAQEWAVPAFEAARDAALTAFADKFKSAAEAVSRKARRALGLR